MRKGVVSEGFLEHSRVNRSLDVAQPALGIFQSKEIGDERAQETDQEEEHQAYKVTIELVKQLDKHI